METMDIACFRETDGRIWMGHGPFTELAAAPEEPAFYINDFSLSAEKPWKVPARLEVVSQDALDQKEAVALPKIAWKRPDQSWFKMVFRRIRKDVIQGKIRKMVPVVTERGEIMEGDINALLDRVLNAPAGLWAYARIDHDRGFLGATPELLLQVKENKVETMALAGTANPQHAGSFESDAKEIDEHEIVAEYLQEKLASLGAVSRSPRAVSDAAGLTHFLTRLSVEPSGDIDLDELVRHLHPTPAVGCLPNDQEAMSKLLEYRKRLDVPPVFGAPFGLKTEEGFRCVIAIRGIGWQANEVTLPSGCGIVVGSAFDHEWRELRLKRDTVARMLGI